MTSDKPNILGIVGSLRRDSYSGAVLRGLQAAVGERAHIEVFPLANVPLYNADLDGEHKPDPVIALKKAIGDCDGLVIVSPEYNYGVPGVMLFVFVWVSWLAFLSVFFVFPVL